jgi:transaldolase/glucose-6-phosphate isomerase
MAERERVWGGDGLDLRLGRFGEAVRARLERWESERFSQRVWQKDHTLWSPEPVPDLVDRLGWLPLPESMRTQAEDLLRFGRDAGRDGRPGMKNAVVLGMGGSSLAPEVFSRTFSAAAGQPALAVLDSTHPDAVRALAGRLDPARTLFLVSSKSGTTTETLSFFRTFWKQTGEALASATDAGQRFAAITDPGTPLEKLARERAFRAVFSTPEDVGGRYSAFTCFGLVPAALLGVDLHALLARGRAMAEACTAPAVNNPGLRLGAALGELARAGCDKATFLASPAIESFPDWLEQLIAESTGKIGRGVVPVVGEAPAAPERYGADRFFVGLVLDGDDSGTGGIEERLAALERAGHPVALIRLADPLDLGREIFRWEMAVAAAGAVIGVNPFDQPDVQHAKELASQAMKQRSAGPEGAAAGGGGGAIRAADAGALGSALLHWLEGIAPGGYLGVHAYLAPTAETTAALREIQGLLRDRTGLATTLGYGPRFLHSTGQLHKGGPDTGRFLQLVDEPATDLTVPETDYTFGRLIQAQADGDRQALEQRGRRVLRVQLGPAVLQGLRALRGALGS